MDTCDFVTLRHEAWISRAEFGALAGVDPRTVRRWEAQGRAPRWAVRLCEALAGRLETAGGPAWAGWRVVRGELCSPEGERFRPGEIRAIPYSRTLIAEYQRQLRPASAPVPAPNVIPFPARPHKELSR